MHKSLLKYKNPYYFKNHPTYEDYIHEQLSIYVQDEDLESLKLLIDSNLMTSDYAIMKMSKCPTSALPFYARYLFYESMNIVEGIKILVQRFFDNEQKLEIYNSIRPLVNHLDLSTVLSLLDQGPLSILIGEYGRKHNLPFEQLGLKNLDLKFLGYFTIEEMGEMEDIDKFIKMDINIMKIVTMWDHPNLINILKNDEEVKKEHNEEVKKEHNEDVKKDHTIDHHNSEINDLSKRNNNTEYLTNNYIRFYLEKCYVNLDLLKKLPFDYDPYTLYLLLDKLRDDETYCKAKLKELTLEERSLVRVLFTTDEDWSRKYADLDSEEYILDLIDNTLETEDDILNCINSLDPTLFHFHALNKLHEFAPKEKLLEIDKILFEKSMIKTIEKFINTDLPVNIEKWMSIDEAYFSLVLRKIPSLFSFHTSVMFNKKKRSQIAKDILKSSDRDLFLLYLDRRGIYVDFLGVEEIEYDFSIEWLKMFINEDNKRIKEIKKHDKLTTKIELQSDKNISIFINPTKVGDLTIKEMRNRLNEECESIKEGVNTKEQRTKDERTKEQRTKDEHTKDKRTNKSPNRPIKDLMNKTIGDSLPRNKKLKVLSVDEQYLLDIYNGQPPTRDFNRLGVLNKFISSHPNDLEGCARLTATVVRDEKQLEDFLRTIPFVIEDEGLILRFMQHLLKCIKFTIPLALVRKWAEGVGAIPLTGKINLNDLNTLFDLLNMDNFKEDLTIGILLRGYSYLLREHPTEGKFRKLKDSDITFYYLTTPSEPTTSNEHTLKTEPTTSNEHTLKTELTTSNEHTLKTEPTTNYEVKIKYQNDLISYSCTDKERFLSFMRTFADSNCPFRREIVLRCIKVLGDVFKGEDVKREDYKGDNVKGNNIKGNNIKRDKYNSNTISISDHEEESVLNLFVIDPKTNLHLLYKLVQDGYKPDKQIAFILVDLLREIRGDQEENIIEILRSHLIDKEMTIYILNHFEYYSYSTKLRIISLLKGPIDLKVFVKYCEIIGNEENIEVLRIILEDLRDRKVYFLIIEKWKSNSKLTKLLKRIYPLGMKDKEFYSGLKWSNEEEKKMIEGVFETK